MIIKTITITDVQFVKEGTGKGGQWYLYNVVDDQGGKYSTFDGGHYQELIGQTVEINYEETRKANSKGQEIIYKNLIEKPASKAVVEKFRASATQINTPSLIPAAKTWNPPANEPAVKSQLDRIEDMVKEIHGQIINPLM